MFVIVEIIVISCPNNHTKYSSLNTESPVIDILALFGLFWLMDSSERLEKASSPCTVPSLTLIPKFLLYWF